MAGRVGSFAFGLLTELLAVVMCPFENDFESLNDVESLLDAFFGDFFIIDVDDEVVSEFGFSHRLVYVDVIGGSRFMPTLRYVPPE